MRLSRLNPFVRIRYAKAIGKRKVRDAERVARERYKQRQQLWVDYINAPTYTEARRILEVLMVTQ